MLETTIAYEQVAVEVTRLAGCKMSSTPTSSRRSTLASSKTSITHSDSALLDRLEGKDANNILQSYTDVAPGRPTIEQHRDPFDDLREHYDHRTAAPITKMNALTITAAEQQTRNYYATVGNVYADPVARQLYAEISSVEEQHVTQYESLIDPHETGLEKWLLHEATEVYNYLGAMQQESNKRIKAIWERFVDYELGHLHFVMDLFRQDRAPRPRRGAPQTLPETILVQESARLCAQYFGHPGQPEARGLELRESHRGSRRRGIYPVSPNRQSRRIAQRAGVRWLSVHSRHRFARRARVLEG